MTSNTSPVGWPVDESAFLTLDLECDFGTALPENRYEALDQVDALVTLLEAFDIPLTCFVQTEVLKTRPEAIESLREADVHVCFHPHSHTHKPRKKTSIQKEVSKSTAAYQEFFGTHPVGYRFPNGNIREKDYELLAKHDYEFDASVFPTWRPGHFNNTRVATEPTYHSKWDIYELPFTVYSEIIRIPTALSYCQVLGKPYAAMLRRRTPSAVVFNIHMHDLKPPSTRRDLPPQYRALYARNPDGLQILERIVKSFVNQGYSFDVLDSVYEQLQTGHGRSGVDVETTS